jgi:hypothetical protein
MPALDMGPQAFYDERESPLSVLPAIRAALIAAIRSTEALILFPNLAFERWRVPR